MTEQNKSIEKLLQDKFADFTPTPSDKVWKGVSRKLFYRKIVALPNVLITLAIIAVVAVAYLYNRTDETKNIQQKNNSTQQTVINNKKQNHKNQDHHPIEKTHVATTTKVAKNNKKTSNKKTQNSQNERTTQEDLSLNIKPKNTLLISNSKKIVKIPSANFTVSENEGCVPFTVYFQAEKIDNAKSNWDFGNNKTAQGYSVKHTYTKAGKYIVKHTALNSDIKNVKTTTIIVNPRPQADFTTAQSEDVSKIKEVAFFNNSTQAVRYIWKFGDNTSSTVVSPIHKYKDAGNYNIKLLAFSEANCADSMTLENLNVKQENYHIKFPNAFTPSLEGAVSQRYYIDDKSNNVFHPKCNTSIANYQLLIYSKNGVLVFSTNDYAVGWNGYYENKLMPQGVYVYICTGNFIDGKPFKKRGNITLLHSKM